MRFHTQFQHDIILLRQFGKVIKGLFAQTIGTGGNDQPHHSLAGKGFPIKGAEPLHRGIRVAVGLKVSQVLHAGILVRKEGYAFLHLPAYRPPFLCHPRRKSRIITVSTPPLTPRSVTVRTGKSRFDADLLHLLPTEELPEMRPETVIPPSMPPGKHLHMLHEFETPKIR